MGMTKATLDLNIQQSTQRAIGQLQQNMMQLDQALRIIDMNMRQSFSAIYTDTVNLRIRINFMLDELKKSKSEAEMVEFEERFKTFFKEETDKINENQKKALEAMEQAQREIEEKAKNENPEPGRIIQ